MKPERPPTPAPEGTRALVGALLRQAAQGTIPIAGPHLVVIEGPTIGQRIALGPAQTFGRSCQATVRFPDSVTSRFHARINTTAGAIHVEDLGSKNGIRVNGKRMRTRHFHLQPGDVITIGATTMELIVPAQQRSEAQTTEPAAASPIEKTSDSAPTRRRWPRRVRPQPATLALVSALALLAAALGLGWAAIRSG